MGVKHGHVLSWDTKIKLKKRDLFGSTIVILSWILNKIQSVCGRRTSSNPINHLMTYVQILLVLYIFVQNDTILSQSILNLSVFLHIMVLHQLVGSTYQNRT